MKKVSIVIGAGYGDEGKGLVTDYLSSIAEKGAIVARFSGGANAGHTVNLSNGTSHIFSHFGAGTFAGLETLLTADFVVNPVLFWQEAQIISKKLKDNGCNEMPLCHIDPSCQVTTPYDVFINQALESSRGDERHGSTGVGLGETIERRERGFGLTVRDFLDPEEAQTILSRIEHEYLPERLEELGLDDADTTVLKYTNERVLEDMIDILANTNVEDCRNVMERANHVIFEGSQGLFLDQDSDEFPHVTRASTGIKNVLQYLSHEQDIYVYYVSRSYLTRHGAGDLVGECKKEELGVTEEDSTNQLNDWQGGLRYAPLDFGKIAAAVQKDLSLALEYNVAVCGVMTWATEGDRTLESKVSALKKAVSASHMLVSYTKTRDGCRWQ